MVEMKHPAETLCYHQHTGFHLYAPFAVTTSTSSTMVEMRHPAEHPGFVNDTHPFAVSNN